MQIDVLQLDGLFRSWYTSCKKGGMMSQESVYPHTSKLMVENCVVCGKAGNHSYWFGERTFISLCKKCEGKLFDMIGSIL